MASRLLTILAMILAVANAQDAGEVTLDGRVLWQVKSGRPGFTPQERAIDLSGNLEYVAKDPRRLLEDVRVLEAADETILLVGRVYLFSVTDEDAKAESRPRSELFADRRKIALDAIRRYRESRQYLSLVRTALIGLATLLGAVFALYLYWVLYRRMMAASARMMAGAFAEGHWLAIYQTFRRPILLLTRFTLRAGLIVVSLVTFFAAGSYILRLYPPTVVIAEGLMGRATEILALFVNGVLSYLPNLLVLGVIFVATWAMLRVAKALADAIARGTITIPEFYPDWASPTYKLLQVLLILFALVVAFPYLPGGDTPALKGASIFVGVLVSLGSGSAMGNVIAGVILTYMRPFLNGDRVRIGETEGDVIGRSLLVTRIRTIKNVEVIVPNSAILNAHILNYSQNARSCGLIVHSTVTIGYDAPWETVHRLLVQAAGKTKCILPEPPPFVLQTSLNDFHISYQINAFTDAPNQMAEIYSDLHRNIQEEFNQGGVEIMSPTYLSLRDGNTVTIPEAHRPPDYRVPGFRVQGEANRPGDSNAASV